MTRLGAIIYDYFPSIYVCIAPVLFFLLISIPVLFYSMITALIPLKNRKWLSFRHWAVPVIPVLIWMIITRQIPFDIRVEITSNHGLPAKEYRHLSAYYTSIFLHFTLVSIFYLSISFLQYFSYKKAVRYKQELSHHHNMGWITFLLVLEVLHTIPAILILLTNDRSLFLVNGLVFFMGGCAIGLFLLLVVHLLKESYLPPVPEARLPSIPSNHLAESGSCKEEKVLQQKTEKQKALLMELTEKEFCSWVEKNKPYLQSGYKLTDMATDLNVSRAKLSGFINYTYGKNFNAYMNGWKLKEVHRLKELDEYKNMPLEQLVILAGFGSYDSYRRAQLQCKIENEEENADG